MRLRLFFRDFYVQGMHPADADKKGDRQKHTHRIIIIAHFYDIYKNILTPKAPAGCHRQWLANPLKI